MPIADAGRGLRHLFVRDLVLAARIGVYPHEHRASQPVRLNLDLAIAESSQAPPQTLAEVVDYAALVARVRALVGAGHTALVEQLAERVAGLCLEDPRVRSARVRVEKLAAIADAAAVGVEIERRNPQPRPPESGCADDLSRRLARPLDKARGQA